MEPVDLYMIVIVRQYGVVFKQINKQQTVDA